MPFHSLSISRQQRNKLWMAEGAAYLLALVIHAGVWHIYQTTPKPLPPEEPPVIEVALIVKPSPVAVSQSPAPATQPPQPKMQPPPVPKPLPKVEKPAPKKVEQPKPKPKPKPKPLPTPAEKPISKPEPHEETESAPAEPVREAPRESHHEAPPAPHAAEEGEGHKAAKAPPEPGEDTQYHQGGLSNVKKRYPRVALERGWEGTVKLKVHIRADGEIGEVIVVNSSGHDELDEMAVELVKEANATPARRGDKPVDSLVIVPYRFTIPKQ